MEGWVQLPRHVTEENEMDEFPRETLELLARRFKLLSHPDRLTILMHLCRSERSVTELRKITGLGQANLSRQLALLDAGGLVRRRAEGTRAFYALADATLPEICGVATRGLAARHDEILTTLHSGRRAKR